MNQIIWFDACFKTISAEHVNKVFPNESSNLSSRTEQQITSLKLPDDVVLYNSNGPENDYEYFPSDSGLTTPLDSTLLLTDSTIVIDDSSVTSIDSSLFANDSLKIPLDSLIAEEDTVEIDWREIDSTARSEQFKYSREDQPYVELKEKKKSKFFIDPSQNLSRRTLQLAQDGEYVEIRELLGSQ
ncbi:MAG: hypothetical protein KJO59_11450, partial [Ignavibacteria bacterium]|nr:hypothetical protein [Ignavibacteria bacterium]